MTELRKVREYPTLTEIGASIRRHEGPIWEDQEYRLYGLIDHDAPLYLEMERSGELSLDGSRELLWVALPRRARDANAAEKQLRINEDLQFPVENTDLLQLHDYYTDEPVTNILVLSYPIIYRIRRARTTAVLVQFA